MPGIPEGTITASLNDRGFETVRHARRDELGKLYLVGSDGTLCGRPYEFSGIVHARVVAGSR